MTQTLLHTNRFRTVSRIAAGLLALAIPVVFGASLVSPAVGSTTGDSQIGFEYWTNEPMSQMIADSVLTSGKAAVAAELRTLASSAQQGIAPNFPGLDGLTARQVSSDLIGMATSVDHGSPVAPSIGSQLLLPDTSSITNSSSSLPPGLWAGKYSVGGESTSNGRAWQMSPTLQYSECGLFTCQVTDRIVVKLVINPGLNGTRTDVTKRYFPDAGSIGNITLEIGTAVYATNVLLPTGFKQWQIAGAVTQPNLPSGSSRESYSYSVYGSNPLRPFSAAGVPFQIYVELGGYLAPGKSGNTPNFRAAVYLTDYGFCTGHKNDNSYCYWA
jgi:hypothetical protein